MQKKPIALSKWEMEEYLDKEDEMKIPIKMTLTAIGILILLFLVIILFNVSFFNNTIKKEKYLLFDSKSIPVEKISEADLEHLPELMKNYLIKAKIIGKSKYCNVTFSQKGTIKTDPKKGWISFTAVQYMSSKNPGFIWKARALPMLIRDKYMDQKGEVKISLLGLKDVASLGPEVDQSSLGRYFGELIWFPIGFLDPDIIWKQIDTTKVKGTITKGDLSLTGYFYFDETGMIKSFSTQRYRDTTLEDFIAEAGEYKNYDGLLIPNKMTAIWNLKGEKFEYFKADIVSYELTENIP